MQWPWCLHESEIQGLFCFIDENFQGVSTLNSSMNFLVENNALWKNSKNMRQQGWKRKKMMNSLKWKLFPRRTRNKRKRRQRKRNLLCCEQWHTCLGHSSYLECSWNCFMMSFNLYSHSWWSEYPICVLLPSNAAHYLNLLPVWYTM